MTKRLTRFSINAQTQWQNLDYRLALAGIIVLLTALAWANRFIQDDAFISFRYAANLVSGKGLVFNPGERVEGYTNFLWTVILSPFLYFDLDPVPVSYILGIICFIISLVFTYRLANLLFSSRTTALLVVFLLGTNYTFSVYATGGLETQLQAALLVVTAYYAFRILEQGPRNYRLYLLLSLLFGLALLNRLDSGVYLVILWLGLLWYMVQERISFRQGVLYIGLLFIPMLSMMGIWLTWKFLVLLEFRGLTQHVGATLVVVLDWVGTRPTPTFADTPRNPKEPNFSTMEISYRTHST